VTLFSKTDGSWLTNVLTVSGVLDDSEAGLTNVITHPQFAKNGLFYLHYACKISACPMACQTAADCKLAIGANCSGGICQTDHTSVLLTLVNALRIFHFTDY
jgi:hypothetical protein